jgi:AraC-like DNA-binding protein
MVRENMHQLVEVIRKTVDEHPMKETQFSFFQMAYVISGTGIVQMNDNRAIYKEGAFILMTPNDSHAFCISSPTELLLIRINSSYVKEYRWKSLDCLECLLYYATRVSGCVMQCKSDMLRVRKIVDLLLLQQQQQNDPYYQDLTMHFVNALIVIAARNISMMKPPNLKPNSDQRIQEIIRYIQNNIYDPQKLKAATIAKEASLSEAYLGSYFKKQCGETIQQFIAQYRMRLIEHRLKFSDKLINEIVAEFGFADESHLNKFFKKHRNMSLSAYRKTVMSAA